MKRQARDRENIFTNHIFGKGFVYTTYKECSKINKKTNQSQNR